MSFLRYGTIFGKNTRPTPKSLQGGEEIMDMSWCPYFVDPRILEPDAIETMVGAMIRHGELNYYVAPRWLWYLDYYKYCVTAFPGYTRNTKNPDLELRFNIYTVDEEHEDEYFRCMEPYRRTVGQLRDDLKICLDRWERSGYWPVFIVDFDQKTFLSRYAEPYEPERFVPDGWIGKWELFPNELIPEEYRFWIDENGVNLWEVFEE